MSNLVSNFKIGRARGGYCAKTAWNLGSKHLELLGYLNFVVTDLHKEENIFELGIELPSTDNRKITSY